jgi:hypothetical protein
MLGAGVQAATVATFADPAVNGSTPLFTLSGGTLTGGWSNPGLKLLMPITGQTYSDATFGMSPLAYDGGTGLSGGNLQFFDSGESLVLRIDFSAARFYGPFGFGASDLAGQVVTVSGPGIPTSLFDESFAFSFANQTIIPGGLTWTASFTSSAVPETSSLLLLGLGLAGWLRRR